MEGETVSARYKQIAETLKRAFPISEEMFLQVRQTLKELFFLRDKAVHPQSGTDIPVPYPEINRISDWRYSAFRYKYGDLLYRLYSSGTLCLK